MLTLILTKTKATSFANSHKSNSATYISIGDLEKPDLRKIAADAELPTMRKKTAKGLCFIGKVRLPVFLQQA